MAYFNVCTDCGGTLDPGEKCDCQKDRYIEKERVANANTLPKAISIVLPEFRSVKRGKKYV